MAVEFRSAASPTNRRLFVHRGQQCGPIHSSSMARVLLNARLFHPKSTTTDEESGNRMRAFQAIHGLALALVLGGIAWKSVARAEVPPSAASPSGEVAVVILMTADVAEDQSFEFGTELYERQFPAFAKEHGLREVSGKDAELTFRLHITQLDEDVNGYVISSAAIYHGEVLTEPERVCLQCTPSEVIAEVLINLERAAAAVVEHRAELEREEAEAALTYELPTPAPEPRVRELGVLSYIGISSVAFGLGGAIAGAVVLGRGIVVESEPGSSLVEATDYRPPGAALLGVGVGMMAIGTAMLGVDVGVLLPRRRAQARAQLDGVAVTSVGGPGVLVVGRF